MSKSQPADVSEPEQVRAGDTDAASKEEEDETLAAADELAPLQVMSQTFSLTLNQMHVVSFQCLLAPCWSPGHQNIKVK